MSRLTPRHRTRWWPAATALVVAASLIATPPVHGVGPASAKPPRTVIAVTFQHASSLYLIHPRTGRSTKIGPTGAELTDVAARGATLYAISFSALYTLDATTGTATMVGSLGVVNANALTARPHSNVLFGANDQGQLFRINRHTGATKVIGRFGHGLGSGGDLVFLGTRLYAAVVRQGTTTSLLARIGVRTGHATVVGAMGFHDVDGLVAANGRLYGGTSHGTMLSISTRTGTGHVLSKTHLPLGGLTS